MRREGTKRSSGRRMKVAAFKLPLQMIARLATLAERTGCSRGAIVRAGVEREIAYREAQGKGASAA